MIILRSFKNESGLAVCSHKAAAEKEQSFRGLRYGYTKK